MADLKTKPTRASVKTFLERVNPEQKRADCLVIKAMMGRATRCRAKMWGPSIVGFGSYHYKYKSGHQGDAILTGFAPRSQAIAIYIMPGLDNFGGLLSKLGKYKNGKSCLYIKRLDDVDLEILEELIARAVKCMKDKYGQA